MTGPRPPRDRGRDPWRGGRPSTPGPAGEPGRRAASHPELEELGDLQISRPRGARPSTGATVSAFLLVGLLAAGMGLLGDRPEAEPSPSGRVSAGAATPAGSPTLAPDEPQVTPASACGPADAHVRDVFLESEATRVAAATELIGWWGSGIVLPTPEPDATGVVRPRVEVRPDAVAELWIDEGACALAWTIELIDPLAAAPHLIETLANEALDVAVASQNRFALPTFAEFRGLDRDVELRATLTFALVRTESSWSIRILPLQWPVARLGSLRRSIPVVAGCDPLLHLGNGWEEHRTEPPCDDDVSADLPPPTLVEPNEELELTFQGWTVLNAMVACGHLSGRSFVSEPLPGCWETMPGLATFHAPAEGGWTLQIGACASQDGREANSVCGTWYAEIEVRARDG